MTKPEISDVRPEGPLPSHTGGPLYSLYKRVEDDETEYTLMVLPSTKVATVSSSALILSQDAVALGALLAGGDIEGYGNHVCSTHVFFCKCSPKWVWNHIPLHIAIFFL